MLRRRQINAAPGGGRLRSTLAAAIWPLRRLGWAVEDRLAAGGELIRNAADVVRWPVERLAWLAERRLLWPLQERMPVGGWDPHGRFAGAGALAAIALAAVLVSVLMLSGGDAPRERLAAPARVALAAPEPPAEQPAGRVLRGVAPSFDAGAGGGVSEPSGDSDAGQDQAVTPTAEDEPTTSDASGAAAASSKKPVPAGPAAMKVARRFSEAFLFYEIGKRPARAKTVFGETATPRLAKALGERPPRQPAEGTVPKARVVNIVPGPRAGRAYTVSVSLLRVGLTTELRLELNKKKGQWVVTGVRG